MATYIQISAHFVFIVLCPGNLKGGGGSRESGNAHVNNQTSRREQNNQLFNGNNSRFLLLKAKAGIHNGHHPLEPEPARPVTGREGRKWRRRGVARDDIIPGFNQTSLLEPAWERSPTYGVHAHVSQLEPPSLRRPRDSEMFCGCFCSPAPSAAILLLSDRLNTTNLLPGACFRNNVDDMFFLQQLASTRSVPLSAN